MTSLKPRMGEGTTKIQLWMIYKKQVINNQVWAFKLKQWAAGPFTCIFCLCCVHAHKFTHTNINSFINQPHKHELAQLPAHESRADRKPEFFLESLSRKSRNGAAGREEKGGRTASGEECFFFFLNRPESSSIQTFSRSDSSVQDSKQNATKSFKLSLDCGFCWLSRKTFQNRFNNKCYLPIPCDQRLLHTHNKCRWMLGYGRYLELNTNSWRSE